VHADAIYRHLVSLLASRTAAEDAMQTVFINAFRNLHRFEGRSSVSTWLHGIAVNVALNTRRSHRREQGFLRRLGLALWERRAPARLEQEVAARQELQGLCRALDTLPPRRAVAFALYYLEELDLSTVAQLLGCSQNTAWARIARGRDSLLKVINRHPLDSTSEVHHG